MKKPIVIANGAGFWGDRPLVPLRLIKNGGFDVLTLEYLAELTMSILAAQKKTDPQMGYVKELPDLIKKASSYLKPGKIKIISNGGGLNPIACAKAVALALTEEQRKKIKIGVVYGDDVMTMLPDLAKKKLLQNMDTGEDIKKILPKILSANVYFGAEGIIKCLQSDADIIITGRVADGSLTLGPIMHHYGWQMDQYNLLASGMVAGHLIECGAQVCGGNYSGRKKTTLNSPGYPIIQVFENGEFLISKEKDTDGEISVGSVAEQLTYEINDPRHYLTPDVDCDFTSVFLKQSGKDVVSVSAGKGLKPSDFYKVSIAYDLGYKCSNTLLVYGPNSLQKARECFEIIYHQTKEEKLNLKEVLPEFLGSGTAVPLMGSINKNIQEVFLRISAYSESKEDLVKFSRLFAPLVTSGPAGVSGYTGGLPKPQKALGFWPALLNKKHLKVETDVRLAESFL